MEIASSTNQKNLNHFLALKSTIKHLEKTIQNEIFLYLRETSFQKCVSLHLLLFIGLLHFKLSKQDLKEAFKYVVVQNLSSLNILTAVNRMLDF